MTRWAESESAFRLYVGYLNDLIKNGKVSIVASASDSLAHTIRATIKGAWKRNQAPYSSLYKRAVISVKDNTVILTMRAGIPIADPISDREFRVMALATTAELLGAIGYITQGKVDRVAFSQLSDFTSQNQELVKRVCEDKHYTYSFTETSAVIEK